MRREQRRYRSAAHRYKEEQFKLEGFWKYRSRLRLKNEFLRRGALISYYQARKDLLEAALDVLHQADKLAYQNVKGIRDRVRHKNVRFRHDVFSAFRIAIGRMHESIGDSKILRNQIDRQIVTINQSLRPLKDRSTPRKFGSGKAIQKLIGERKKNMRREFSTRHELDFLDLGNVAFEMDEKASCCRVRISSLMAHCFCCGKKRHPERMRKWPSSHKQECSPGVEFCKECNAPVPEEFIFCFNCGSALDPFGFKELS